MEMILNQNNLHFLEKSETRKSSFYFFETCLKGLNVCRCCFCVFKDRLLPCVMIYLKVNVISGSIRKSERII